MKYLVKTGNGIHGPFSAAELASHRQQGLLGPDTLCAEEHDPDNWRPLDGLLISSWGSELTSAAAAGPSRSASALSLANLPGMVLVMLAVAAISAIPAFRAMQTVRSQLALAEQQAYPTPDGPQLDNRRDALAHRSGEPAIDLFQSRVPQAEIAESAKSPGIGPNYLLMLLVVCVPLLGLASMGIGPATISRLTAQFGSAVRRPQAAAGGAATCLPALFAVGIGTFLITQPPLLTIKRVLQMSRGRTGSDLFSLAITYDPRSSVQETFDVAFQFAMAALVLAAAVWAARRWKPELDLRQSALLVSPLVLVLIPVVGESTNGGRDLSFQCAALVVVFGSLYALVHFFAAKVARWVPPLKRGPSESR